MAKARSRANPYAHRVPKPKILDMIALLRASQRANYRKLSRSLKRIPGVHGEMNFYGSSWGWALRYRRGDATLCTVHMLPEKFEATITVTRTLEEWAMGPNHLSPTTKRDLVSLRRYSHTKWLTMPLGSERRTRDLVRMMRFKITGS
ncbi:MAG: DUF3788 family protein [Acidobacteria bacterium]|nr:DUF3788 family protein [Acidobacteriota bacterium]